MITLLLPVCVGVCVTAALLVHGPLRRRTFGRAVTRLRRPATTPGRSLPEVFEVLRLGLAAALLDLGNHLMLCAEERRAFRLKKRLSSARVRRLGVAAAALRAGARRPDDITLEIPIGERTQEGNPRRTLALSCVVYEPLGHHASDPPEDDGASLFRRVENRPLPGHRGPSVTVDVPDLDKALISYDARPCDPREGPPAGASSTRARTTSRLRSGTRGKRNPRLTRRQGALGFALVSRLTPRTTGPTGS